MRRSDGVLGYAVYCRPLSSERLIALREARVAAMWGRFLRLMEAEGRATDRYLTVKGVQAKVLHMRHAVRHGAPAGWFFASGLEAADLGIDPPQTTASGERTEAMPGTREKLEVLVARVANGVPLWNSKDGVLDEE